MSERSEFYDPERIVCRMCGEVGQCKIRREYVRLRRQPPAEWVYIYQCDNCQKHFQVVDREREVRESDV